jgi:hypothetical protein
MSVLLSGTSRVASSPRCSQRKNSSEDLDVPRANFGEGHGWRDWDQVFGLGVLLHREWGLSLIEAAGRVGQDADVGLVM